MTEEKQKLTPIEAINEFYRLKDKYETSYYEKYMDARRQAGIKETTEDSQVNFIKYMVEDAPLDF